MLMPVHSFCKHLRFSQQFCVYECVRIEDVNLHIFGLNLRIYFLSSLLDFKYSIVVTAKVEVTLFPSSQIGQCHNLDSLSHTYSLNALITLEYVFSIDSEFWAPVSSMHLASNNKA
jgi:hypothetical protein